MKVIKLIPAFAVLCLINQNQAILLQRKFKMGDDVIEFDEEAEYKEIAKKEGPTLEKLLKADNDMLSGFDDTLASSVRNIGKGDLNIEMGKA